jgi:hypothetical protein
LITIDTEGDNLWACPREITTRNAQFLPRFQALCERHGLKPTYLTNYEMVQCPQFREFALDVQRRGTAEIGMHLHAWNSPPLWPLTPDDFAHQPYLMEYPESVMREKIVFLTDLLEATFERKMVSHRAGRWGFNAVYARLLAECGYRVDCSVTPHLSWKDYAGNPSGNGGPDFTRFPDYPYYLDLQCIDHPGVSSLLEVPLTVMPCREQVGRWLRGLAARGPSLVQRVVGRLYPPPTPLRPRRGNCQSLLRLLEWARRQERPYVEFILHSSEFMPGGSPTFVTERDIEALYNDMDLLFAEAGKWFKGATLHEFCQAFDATAAGKVPAVTRDCSRTKR